MNGMLKFAMAAVIALASGNAYAQVRTGKEVLNANTNQWQPGALTGTNYIVGTQVNSETGTFHAGGVAACDGCHVMHNASYGVARSTKVAPWTNAVPAFLLQGSDQSSTCLVCHGDNVAGRRVQPLRHHEHQQRRRQHELLAGRRLRLAQHLGRRRPHAATTWWPWTSASSPTPAPC